MNPHPFLATIDIKCSDLFGYYWDDQIKKHETEGTCSMRDMRNACAILVGKPGCKTLLGKCMCIWENDIKMNLRETGCEGGD